MPPYTWQLDVSEALILGLDAVVIAGTGVGKTIPFMMPLLLHRDKIVLVISPLKVLQDDQVSIISSPSPSSHVFHSII
jgi:bloom syndrome protein